MSIFELFTKESLLTQVLTEIDKMFDKNKKMFESATDFLFEDKKMNFDIRKEDKELNAFEIQIRKKIFEHLSINPDKDLAFSLIIIDVARDTERVGDYCKNLYKLAAEFPDVKKESLYWIRLKEMSEYLTGLIKDVHIAFRKSDQELANSAIATYRGKVYEPTVKLINEISSDNSLNSKETVILVLTARYFRRISAFLINIATTVVNDFPRIRYTEDNDDV